MNNEPYYGKQARILSNIETSITLDLGYRNWIGLQGIVIRKQSLLVTFAAVEKGVKLEIKQR